MGMRINRRNILEYSEKYDQQYRNTDGQKVEEEMKLLLRTQRHLTFEDLIKIVGWKTRNRAVHHCKKNNPDKVRELTQCSFRMRDEKVRIESLLGQKGGLRGVGYPVASTILHFAFPVVYPIIDFRVLRSLWDLKQPIHYDFKLWERYCKRIRSLGKKGDFPIRTVEKALWKYDEINSGKRKTCKQ